MKRRRRHIARWVVLTLSTLSILAAFLAWARSYRTLDELSRAGGGGVIESVLSFRGGLHFARSGGRAADRSWMWDDYDVPPRADWDVLYRSGELKFRALGFGWLRGQPFTSAQPFGVTTGPPLVPWLNAPPYNAVVLPYWFVIVLLAAPWWWRALAPMVARLRRQPGTCRRCGYDLRATPQRCPECGLASAK